MLHETEMAGYFQRQLADYVEYHRDPWNCAMHVVGILLLFTGAVLPLTRVQIPVFGLEVSLAVILALPVLVYWLMLDAGIGLGILAAAVVLLSVATAIGNQASTVMMWSIFAVLIALGVGAQIVGHRVFEERQPSMVDHPTHFLLGPMFVMAKLFIALGFRRDLAAILAPISTNSLSTR
ncbi:Mpo1-like protein [Bradyrhizobium sp. CB1650]|uniref:Mpo1 family 2-hydroxy fatty acid dioxygenase n=1 Tax=Bradyrhizobium sp. CB1650 TaxID=3039153 RepID=UPI00325FA2CD